MNFDSFSRFFEIVFENFDIEEIISLVIAGTIFLLCYYAVIQCFFALVRAKDQDKKRTEMNTIALLFFVSICCVVYIWAKFASVFN